MEEKMKSQSITQQFEAAVQEWAKRTGEEESHIAILGLLYTGGLYHLMYEVEAEEQGAGLKSLGSIVSLTKLIERLDILTTQYLIQETFLIVSLIRYIQDELDKSANKAKLVETNRERARKFDEILENEEARQNWITIIEGGELIKQARESGRHVEPYTVEKLRNGIQAFKELTAYDPEAHMKDRENRQVWRDVTASILAEENIELHRGRDFDLTKD